MRRGVTLVELMVVIALLGLMAGITTVALARRPAVPAADVRVAPIVAARTAAIRRGRDSTVVFEVDGVRFLATAHPDGRIVAAKSLGIDPLSGRRADVGR